MVVKCEIKFDNNPNGIYFAGQVKSYRQGCKIPSTLLMEFIFRFRHFLVLLSLRLISQRKFEVRKREVLSNLQFHINIDKNYQLFCEFVNFTQTSTTLDRYLLFIFFIRNSHHYFRRFNFEDRRFCQGSVVRSKSLSKEDAVRCF